MFGFFLFLFFSVILVLGGFIIFYVFFSSVIDMNWGIVLLFNGCFGVVDIDEKKRIKMWFIYFKRVVVGYVFVYFVII